MGFEDEPDAIIMGWVLEQKKEKPVPQQPCDAETFKKPVEMKPQYGTGTS